VENPITHARGVIQLQEHATPAQKVLLDRLQAIEERLSTFDDSVRAPNVRVGTNPSISIDFDERASKLATDKTRKQIEELARESLPIIAIGQASDFMEIVIHPVIGARATLQRFGESLIAIPGVARYEVSACY